MRSLWDSTDTSTALLSRCLLKFGGIKRQKMIMKFTQIVKLGTPSHVSTLNSFAPGRSEYDSKNVISTLVLLVFIFRFFFMIMPSGECHITLLTMSQHWFRWWPGAVRQQAITWANVDPHPCRHMTLPGHNEWQPGYSFIHLFILFEFFKMYIYFLTLHKYTILYLGQARCNYI